MPIGSRIKAIRGALSQKDFAVKIGAGQKSIHSWEAGHAAPGARSLEAIHRVFGVDIHWLLTGEGDRYIKKDRNDLTLPGIPSESPAEYEERATGLGQAVEMLATVLESRNQVFIRALMSDLVAFNEAVTAASQTVTAAKQQSQQISDLRFEFDEVCRRLAALEKRLEKESDLGKQETVEEKAM